MFTAILIAQQIVWCSRSQWATFSQTRKDPFQCCPEWSYLLSSSIELTSCDNLGTLKSCVACLPCRWGGNVLLHGSAPGNFSFQRTSCRLYIPVIGSQAFVNEGLLCATLSSAAFPSVVLPHISAPWLTADCSDWTSWWGLSPNIQFTSESSEYIPSSDKTLHSVFLFTLSHKFFRTFNSFCQCFGFF